MINCFNILEENGYEKYQDVSLKWTDELINLLSPKIIICEGKGVFDKLAKNQKNINWSSDCGFFQKNNITIIGYSRRMSSIRNKEGVAELISKYWKNGK